jgi:hypothetical protein
VTDWPALKEAVNRRERGCIARRRDIFGADIASDRCDGGTLEFDHIREDIGGQRYDDEAHGIAVCGWHHRLSAKWRSDSKEHRAVERAYLAKLYPTVWEEQRRG